MSAKTAVLLMTFARSRYARQVFDRIKDAKPEKFYFYSNKAREGRPTEVAENEEIRSWVKEVDWPCELHTFFRDEYVDVYTSTRGAMDWVFENEEAAVIFEDDCVPSVSFFDFCDRLLEMYKNDESIGYISGANYIENYVACGGDHFKSPVNNYWGFAIWRDRWQGLDFDVDPKDVVAGGYIDRYYWSKKMRVFYRFVMSESADFIRRTKVWDFVLTLANYKKKRYGIYPVVSLVRNIGADGSHTDGGMDPGTYVSTVYEGAEYPFSLLSEPLCDKTWDMAMFRKILLHTGRSIVIKMYLYEIFGDKIYGKFISVFRKIKKWRS